MKRALFALATLAAGAWWAFAPEARGPDPRSGPAIARVVRRSFASSVRATGVVRPTVGAEVRVGSRVSGVVRRLHVRIGDLVEPGRLLAELEAGELEARVAQAAAALESARAGRRYAEADLERTRALVDRRLAAPADLDLRRRAFDVAAAQVAEAQANLDYARVLLGWTEIRAPIAGTVASVSTQEGETVAASLAAPTFVTLLDLTRLEIRAYVDEVDIGRIRPGQEAAFTVDTYPDAVFEGVVAAVYPQAEIRDNVVDYVAVVTFEPPRDRSLRPEMTATVRIALETRDRALAAPRRALRREGGRTYVLCPRDGQSERRWVVAGATDGDACEIVEGLEEGDAVFVGPVPEEEDP